MENKDLYNELIGFEKNYILSVRNKEKEDVYDIWECDEKKGIRVSFVKIQNGIHVMKDHKPLIKDISKYKEGMKEYFNN